MYSGVVMETKKWETESVKGGVKCLLPDLSGDVFTAFSRGNQGLAVKLSKEIVTLAQERGYKAIFFETPKLDLKKNFEFVVLDATSTALATAGADHETFAGKCSRKGEDASVASFSNLGGDATLVVPCARDTTDSFAHLLKFLNTASNSRLAEFWKTAGSVALEKSQGTSPTWISTCGLGVFWLHLRFDSRPKYYSFTPYKEQ
eukprot:TRINITY_DN5954_c1_g1_i1.p1 TRINITY_DN5954_c1_g1~~TRINITY_DN5954_c1_g1_i1.p1  ORF type:complete len:203 (+),score=16.66 TRINITY_DN5954_c1_g1_i1:102-710(+)